MMPWKERWRERVPKAWFLGPPLLPYCVTPERGGDFCGTPERGGKATSPLWASHATYLKVDSGQVSLKAHLVVMLEITQLAFFTLAQRTLILALPPFDLSPDTW